MKVSLSVLALLASTAAHAASPSPQLYFSSPQSPSPSPSSPAPPSALTAPQANAALAHLLSVSQHVALPLSTGKNGRDWEKVLHEQVDPSETKVVVVLDCPKYGCEDAIPPSLLTSPRYTLPSLPSHSYLSAVSLHLHRFASALGLSASSPTFSSSILGLKEVTDEGLKSQAGWQGWVGEELGGFIGWHEKERKVKAQVEDEMGKTGLLGDAELLDEAAAPLYSSLARLSSLADEIYARASGAAATDESAAEGVPQVVVVHIKGLKDLAAAHAPSSPTYTRAVALLRDTLSGFTSSIASSCASSSGAAGARTLLLTLPPHSTPLLRKRTAWLAPFEHAGSRYQARSKAAKARAMNRNVRRSVFSSRQSGEGEEDDWARNAPIVPSSSICFKDEQDARNQTAACLGRGKAVRGISTRELDGGECWVCRCEKGWKGEGCEKEDLSSPFTLLLLSTLGLLAVLGLAVGLLAKVGGAPLPGTLGAVGGGGGHAKRE
ncbi:hypothetical protein JCM10213_009082 [Rhodosporidiobolus nylandii]